MTGQLRTADADDGGTARKNAHGADISSRQSVLDGSDEEAAAEADDGCLGRLVEHVVGDVDALSRLAVTLLVNHCEREFGSVGE